MKDLAQRTLQTAQITAALRSCPIELLAILPEVVQSLEKAGLAPVEIFRETIVRARERAKSLEQQQGINHTPNTFAPADLIAYFIRSMEEHGLNPKQAIEDMIAELEAEGKKDGG